MSIGSVFSAVRRKLAVSGRWYFTGRKKRSDLAREVLACIKLCPETQALLELAQKDGVRISFSQYEILGTNTFGYYFQKRAKTRIKLSALEKDGTRLSAELIATFLAHELRHHWQCKRLGLQGKDRKGHKRQPYLSFIFNRVAEADAHAFSMRFLNKIWVARGEIKESSDSQEERPQEIFRYFFSQIMQSETALAGYDLERARHLYKTHPSYYDSTQKQMLTLAKIRDLCRAGIDANAPSYIDEMPDIVFEMMILNKADKRALKVCKLIDSFAHAIAENKSAEAGILQRKVTQAIQCMNNS